MKKINSVWAVLAIYAAFVAIIIVCVILLLGEPTDMPLLEVLLMKAGSLFGLVASSRVLMWVEKHFA